MLDVGFEIQKPHSTLALWFSSTRDYVHAQRAGRRLSCLLSATGLVRAVSIQNKLGTEDRSGTLAADKREKSNKLSCIDRMQLQSR